MADDIFIPLTDPRACFVDYLLGGYHVQAPRFLVERHPRPCWEQARFQSIEAHLRPGDILVDVGAEQGQQSAIYARFIGGGENMVLVEPCPDVWPNIMATWRANGLATPLATWCGFAGVKTESAAQVDFEDGYRDGWPLCAYREQLLDATKFRYLSEQQSSTPTVSLDDFLGERGIVPAALTIDVEGYEPRVLEGAIETIKAASPLIWCSLHESENNILRRHEGGDPVTDVHWLMRELGYQGTHIATDHESHWIFQPVDRR